jgi:hypothetical protein
MRSLWASWAVFDASRVRTCFCRSTSASYWPSNAVTWLIRLTKAGPTGRAKRCGIPQQDLELFLARVLDLLPVGESTKDSRVINFVQTG